jgi:hypothetical protein
MESTLGKKASGEVEVSHPFAEIRACRRISLLTCMDFLIAERLRRREGVKGTQPLRAGGLKSDEKNLHIFSSRPGTLTIPQ